MRIDHETDQPWRDPATGFCARVSGDEPGELLVQLPSDDVAARFQGYYGNAEATASKVARDVFCRGDAWFRSGDLVRVVDDGGRLYYFCDRIGDTFRWKSENVSTAEVAQVLGTHPAVREANVYGVRLPRHDGRAGCVAIALALDSTTKAEALTSLLADLANHAARNLPRYAVPLFLRIVDDVGLQLTGTNKQQKHVLRDQGVDPAKVQSDRLFWLRNGTYVPFGAREWNELRRGAVKL